MAAELMPDDKVARLLSLADQSLATMDEALTAGSAAIATAEERLSGSAAFVRRTGIFPSYQRTS